MTYLKHTSEILWSHIGLAALSLATVLTVIELGHVRPKALAVQTTSTASHSGQHTAVYGQGREKGQEHGQGEHKEHMRKDKEEIRHMSHSYGVLMRSHPTAGTA